jgi:hypothetical protein
LGKEQAHGFCERHDQQEEDDDLQNTWSGHGQNFSGRNSA